MECLTLPPQTNLDLNLGFLSISSIGALRLRRALMMAGFLTLPPLYDAQVYGDHAAFRNLIVQKHASLVTIRSREDIAPEIAAIRTCLNGGSVQVLMHI